jgi:type IV secretory pathway VirB10-like protein
MTELNSPATVPDQPEVKPPVRKTMPVVIALAAIVALIGIANVSSLLNHKKTAQASAMPTRPAAPNAQQVSSFEAQQQIEARRDANERQHQQEIAAALQQLQGVQDVPGPESTGAPPMSVAQRAAIYGDSPNAPPRTSNMSQAQAEAKQRALAREKQAQDAIASDTVAIDFEHESSATVTSAASPATSIPAPVAAVAGQRPHQPGIGSAVDVTSAAPISAASEGSLETAAGTAQAARTENKTESKTDPMAPYEFDEYQGQLYRVFEGTVLEGVVTNHIDGGLSGPILVMLTTDYYSHDHQQLLMPQGTRLIGNVQSVGSAQQRKMFVTFHRAVCPDGFSLDFDKYIGLDPLGTTGLATKVDHGYLMAFGAAAAIGGLGGLAQIGNSTSILDPSTQIRNGISAESSQEGEQILNHFLNRLPVITLKEGSRARVYIGRDILIPSYAEHRVNPTL